MYCLFLITSEENWKTLKFLVGLAQSLYFSELNSYVYKIKFRKLYVWKLFILLVNIEVKNNLE